VGIGDGGRLIPRRHHRARTAEGGGEGDGAGDGDGRESGCRIDTNWCQIRRLILPQRERSEEIWAKRIYIVGSVARSTSPSSAMTIPVAAGAASSTSMERTSLTRPDQVEAIEAKSTPIACGDLSPLV